MKFSYSAVWDDTARMLKSHSSVLFALGGVFLLLPTLLTGYFLPMPASQTNPLGAMMEHYQENWLELMLSSLVNSVGAVAIYLLLFDKRGGTVGSAIAAALPIVPLYFLMSLLVWLMFGLGFVLFIIPGIYLVGRLAISGPVMVAEGRRSPIAAMGAAWRLTSGNGWAVAGLIVIVAVAGFILTLAVVAVLGTVIQLVAGRDGVGGLLVLILNSALSAALYTVLFVLLAAIYRRLTTAGSAGPVTEQGELRRDVPRE